MATILPSGIKSAAAFGGLQGSNPGIMPPSLNANANVLPAPPTATPGTQNFIGDMSPPHTLQAPESLAGPGGPQAAPGTQNFIDGMPPQAQLGPPAGMPPQAQLGPPAGMPAPAAGVPGVPGPLATMPGGPHDHLDNIAHVLGGTGPHGNGPRVHVPRVHDPKQPRIPPVSPVPHMSPQALAMLQPRPNRFMPPMPLPPQGV